MKLLDTHSFTPIADSWDYLEEGENLAEHIASGGKLIVPFEMLDSEKDSCLKHISQGGKLGVIVKTTQDIHALLPYLNQLHLVVMNFPHFANGRGFSKAVWLKNHGYRGKLRAKGWLLPDQKSFLFQCGFDNIEIEDEIYARHGESAWQGELDITLSYQQGIDHKTPQNSIMQQRWQNQ